MPLLPSRGGQLPPRTANPIHELNSCNYGSFAPISKNVVVNTLLALKEDWLHENEALVDGISFYVKVEISKIF